MFGGKYLNKKILLLVHQDDGQTCPDLDDGSVLMGSLFQCYKQNLGRINFGRL